MRPIQDYKGRLTDAKQDKALSDAIYNNQLHNILNEINNTLKGIMSTRDEMDIGKMIGSNKLVRLEKQCDIIFAVIDIMKPKGVEQVKLVIANLDIEVIVDIYHVVKET